MPKPKINPKMNGDWFVKKLAERDESNASLARYMNASPSKITLMFQGLRRFQMEDAEKIAQFLHAPIEDVLEHGGLRMKRDPSRPQSVRLVGTVDARMAVKMTTQGAQVEGHASLPHDAVAVRVQTAGTQADDMDGWLLFFQPARGLDPALVHRLCIAELDDGARQLGVLRRGYEPGTFNLVSAGRLTENLTIRSAMPILWIKP